MKPVDQRLTDRYIGDCLTCCVASILELPYEEVPLFNKIARERGCSWFHPFFEFLDPRSLQPWCINAENFYEHWEGKWADKKPEYVVACGKSPRGDWRHAVVWKEGEGIVFDPHPSRAGLDGEPTDFIVLLPRERCP